MERRGTIGVIANPLAGKDIRRLATHAGHTPDTAKVGIVRRVIAAAIESGIARVVLAPDTHRLSERAAAGLESAGRESAAVEPAGREFTGRRGAADGADARDQSDDPTRHDLARRGGHVGGVDAVEIDTIDMPLTASRLDTIGAARAMRASGADVVVVLGGDGTCRDVALGWPDVVLVPISTGTNNVFPLAVDATSAGVAAALVASGAVTSDVAVRRSKRVAVTLPGGHHDTALVDLAVIATAFSGARAVTDPTSVRTVIAAFATPASTGLSSIAGRSLPVGRFDAGGVHVELGDGGRALRVPLGPGTFSTVHLTSCAQLAIGDVVTLRGPGMLAFDGERDRRLGVDEVAEVRITDDGPSIVDVDAVLHLAVSAGMFAETERGASGATISDVVLTDSDRGE